MGPDYLQEYEDWMEFCERQAAAGEFIIVAQQGRSWQQTRDEYFAGKSYLQRDDAEWNF